MTPAPDAPCPCGRSAPTAPTRRLAWGDCCGRWLGGGAPVPDAESLMRSRYSAFVREDAAWLLATWHASTRPAALDFEPRAQWLGLELRRHRRVDAEHAEVEFVARYRVAGRAVCLHETSRFVREQGRWYYLDGTQR